MKTLRDILYGVALLRTAGDTQAGVKGLALDSRKVAPGFLFAALRGTQVDGHAFIDQAVKQGATAILCEEWPAEKTPGVCYLVVKNSARALGIVADNYYDRPSAELQLVAITGTNGKTTTATLLYQLGQNLGHTCGLISTVHVRVGEEERPATHTTPDPIYLHSCLRDMADAGVSYVFMEASSHGIDQERMAGLKLRGAVFTNLSRDHLDYHGSFQNYLHAKKKLFDELPKGAFALTNIDDKNGKVMLQNSAAERYSYALKSDADFKGRLLEQQRHGMLLRLGQQEVWVRLLGQFNAYNVLALYAVAQLLGEEELAVATALSKLQPVRGRFEYIQAPGGGLTVVVDYAHTPDALENVLQTLQEMRAIGGKIWTIIGCGGNRDKGKRPEMAQIAVRYSDQAIFTADNPRHEDPETIIEDMTAGVPGRENRYLSISNRRQAIKTALQMAGAADLVLIAGKGHENYQEIAGERKPFDDLAVAREFLPKAGR
jgi:UDP-N-acetylmuramoyl-L-alanyl-D-glutamate--2,6-diaminopimelate ligase